jgi:hypothetical protein
MIARYDIEIIDDGYNAGQIRVRPISVNGEKFFADKFGVGAVAVTCRKSTMFDLVYDAERAGMKCKISDRASK